MKKCRCLDQSFAGSRKRGVTLLELLIVIALLLAMAVAIGPTVLSTLDERAFESAMDVTARQMMLARAHAQASGQPVQVLYTRAGNEPGYISARLFSVDPVQQEQPLVHSWAERPLPAFLTVTTEQPQPEHVSIRQTMAPEAAYTELDAAMGESSDDVSIRMGVFLPDGSAMAGSPRWLSDADGRAARMSVNPYTGEVQFTRLPPPDLREPTEGDEMDEADAAEETQWEEP